MRPLILFENHLANGTLTAGSEAGGFPKENAIAWDIHTAGRWKAADTTSPVALQVDLGSGNEEEATAFAIGGANISTMGSGTRYVAAYHSDNGSVWTVDATLTFPGDYTDAEMDLPHVLAFDSPGVHRYWKIEFWMGSGSFSEAPQCGIATVGRALYLQGANAALDWYSSLQSVAHLDNEAGDFLGSNLMRCDKALTLDYTGAALSKTGFFAPAADIGFDDEFADHVQDGNPFWFAWAPTVTDTLTAYLVRTDEARTPFAGTVAHRHLITDLRAYREAA